MPQRNVFYKILIFSFCTVAFTVIFPSPTYAQKDLSISTIEIKELDYTNESNNLKKLIVSNQLFDPSYYSSQYLDVRDASIDPLDHYCQFGYFEDRDPHPHFNTKSFKRHLIHINADLVKSNPLSTYLELPKDKKGPDLLGSFQYREYLTSTNKSLVDVDGLEFVEHNKTIKIH